MPRYRLNCQICTDTQKRYRGCEAEALQPFILEIDGEREKLTRCPLTMITAKTIRIMRYHRFFRDGFLPSIGGIDQQSAKLLEAFEVIDNEKEKVREKDKDARAHSKQF